MHVLINLQISNYAVASKVDKSTSSNSMVQEKYVTVSCYKKTIEEARTYFHFDIQESMRKGHSFKIISARILLSLKKIISAWEIVMEGYFFFGNMLLTSK